jgi:hypothetical protein
MTPAVSDEILTTLNTEGERAGRARGRKGKGKRTQDIGMGIRDCHDLKKRGLAMTD